MASSLQQIYRGLCSLAVFRGMNDTALFGRFAAFAESTPDSPERLRAYAAFVEEIYASGSNLADSVRHILFADENVYVKTIGLGEGDYGHQGLFLHVPSEDVADYAACARAITLCAETALA